MQKHDFSDLEDRVLAAQMDAIMTGTGILNTERSSMRVLIVDEHVWATKDMVEAVMALSQNESIIVDSIDQTPPYYLNPRFKEPKQKAQWKREQNWRKR